MAHPSSQAAWEGISPLARESLSGSLAASFTAALFNPLEVVKTRIQLQYLPGQPRLYTRGFVAGFGDVSPVDRIPPETFALRARAIRVAPCCCVPTRPTLLGGVRAHPQARTSTLIAARADCEARRPPAALELRPGRHRRPGLLLLWHPHWHVPVRPDVHRRRRPPHRRHLAGRKDRRRRDHGLGRLGHRQPVRRNRTLLERVPPAPTTTPTAFPTSVMMPSRPCRLCRLDDGPATTAPIPAALAGPTRSSAPAMDAHCSRRTAL